MIQDSRRDPFILSDFGLYLDFALTRFRKRGIVSLQSVLGHNIE